MADKTFIKITNRDIFNKIEELNNKIDKMKIDNREAHTDIIDKQIRTNGRVKLSVWIGTTALSLVIIAIGFILNKV